MNSFCQSYAAAQISLQISLLISSDLLHLLIWKRLPDQTCSRLLCDPQEIITATVSLSAILLCSTFGSVRLATG